MDLKESTLYFRDYNISEHQLTMNFGIDEMTFSCKYWFADFNLKELIQKYSLDFFQKIIFHCMCFQANKLCSLRPKYMNLGNFAKFWNSKIQTLWRKCFFKIWGQWRYVMNDKNYLGPTIVDWNEFDSVAISPIKVQQGKVKSLCFVGGGKDSLTSITCLENIGEDFDILTYTNTVYGKRTKQIELMNPFMDNIVKNRYYCQYVIDDFLDSPLTEIPEFKHIKSILAGETPSSIFGGLFWVMAKGYQNIILGHEKSADIGNLLWENEEINHQWGKSTEAETLISEYVKEELITNVHYFSILKCLYDVGIIMICSTRESLIQYTDSCNIDKPWCSKCPKCCYVWTLYMAFMDQKKINQMFKNKNLMDTPENEFSFRQLLGLEDQTPFECVGRVEEVRLSFEIMRRKGIRGKMMKVFAEEVPKLDYNQIIDTFSKVDYGYSRIPSNFREKLLSFMESTIGKKRQEVKQILSS